ncbi:putative actin patch assembly and actin polymerization protein [Xylographa opegraphella]|nr:putative actin patch assembly and actin polymerization protein [Xylographa opegraphella]
MSLFRQAKPYTAITVQIERMTKPEYEVEDLSGIVDLIEVIKLQSSGPTEAARAIRKKLKYGDVHRQLRALTILDGLIQNAGPRFQRTFADEPLLERLRVAATDSLSDDDVKKKCSILFRQWAASYKSTPGMDRIASLYKQLPQRKKPAQKEQSKALRETEAPTTDTEVDVYPTASGSTPISSPLHSPVGKNFPASSSHRPKGLLQNNLFQSSKSQPSKSKSSRSKTFDLYKEKPIILAAIASSSLASINLMNTMKLINREHQRVSEDRDAVQGFDYCKRLRRQVLAYLQHIESGDLLGGLLHANDELVEALMAYEILDKSLEDDSDSEDDFDDGASSSAMAGLSMGNAKAPSQSARPGFIAMPPRAANGKGVASRQEQEEEEDPVEEEDENDPFADRNAAGTPRVEKGGMTWRDV